MTEEHYKIIADTIFIQYKEFSKQSSDTSAIDSYYAYGYSQACYDIANKLADQFCYLDCNFDRQRFIDACLWLLD